jgi:hypothetical protein
VRCVRLASLGLRALVTSLRILYVIVARLPCKPLYELDVDPLNLGVLDSWIAGSNQ